MKTHNPEIHEAVVKHALKSDLDLSSMDPNWIDVKCEDCMQWAKNGEEVINAMQDNTRNSLSYGLRIIYLFR